MKLHQSKVRIPKTKKPKKRMRKVMIRSTKSTRPPPKRLNKLRAETKKLTLSSTKLRKRTNQQLLKLTLLPRPSPLSKRNLRLLIKKLSKKPLTPPNKRQNLLKSKNKN